MADVQKVAVRMMRQSGFGNVTVEQIAAAAGVSPSTVYRYFGTKEALIVWGDRPDGLVESFASAKVGKRAATAEAFFDAATATYADDAADLLSQLRLVFASPELAVAFEHQLLTRRGEVAAIVAARRKAKSVGVRDVAAAGAYLGALVALLDRWQSGDGEKSLAKMLAKAPATIAG